MPYQTATARFTRTLCAGALLLAGTMSAIAQTDTTFTYQGELNLLGTPVDGMCDFRFQLFEANIGGASLTKSLSKSNVTVANGRFSVDLDFGPGVFDGDQRWLNIDVRYPAGSGTFSTLSPRQQITRSPYSIQTRGIYVDGNERVGIGMVCTR